MGRPNNGAWGRGRLCYDPNFSNKKRKFSYNTVAVKEFFNQDGERKEICHFLKITAWDGIAERLSKMPKGQMIEYTGKNISNQYEKQNVKIQTNVIVIDNFYKCAIMMADEGNGNHSQQNNSSSGESQPQQESSPNPNPMEDDLPF